MRAEVQNYREKDARITYRGSETSRLDNLTDAVFGIAITLLIFNTTNPDSFEDLINFTKTLPAFLLGIGFLILIWKEHLNFSEIYDLQDGIFVLLNTIFLALIIFYVYPLRFFMLFFTNFFFNTGVNVDLNVYQVPDLMIYYGFAVSSLYFIIALFYSRALVIQRKLQLNDFEVFWTQQHRLRIIIMMTVPIFSVLITFLLKNYSVALASIFGGVSYNLYIPCIILWKRRFNKLEKQFQHQA